MTIFNYAGGIFFYATDNDATYLLLGKSAYKDKGDFYDILSAKRDTSEDNTRWEELSLEESLANKISDETANTVLSGQEIYDAITSSDLKITSIIRTPKTGKNLEYKIFPVKLNFTPETVIHSNNNHCSCIPCRFQKLDREKKCAISQLTWMRVDTLAQTNLRQNNSTTSGTIKLNPSIRTVIYDIVASLKQNAASQ